MRVDCYNASECPLYSLEYGDTFYLDGRLYLKVAPVDVDVFQTTNDRCYIVALDKGELKSIKFDASVILADTKVIVNTKETF